eukprot:1162115-Pelagomonas_calceolata.AAC.5
MGLIGHSKVREKRVILGLLVGSKKQGCMGRCRDWMPGCVLFEPPLNLSTPTRSGLIAEIGYVCMHSTSR